MKRLILSLIIATGCAPDADIRNERAPSNGKDGKSCSVSKTEKGSLVKCGDGEVLVENGKDGKDGENGKDGSNGSNGFNGSNGSNGQDYKAPTSLEGFYNLPNGGYLELVENYDKSIIIYGTQRIYSTNTDGTSVLYPALPTTTHTVHSGSVTGEVALTYAAANGLEVDITNVAIAGSRKTVYTFSKDTSGHLVIKILTYSATGLNVESTRTITSL